MAHYDPHGLVAPHVLRQLDAWNEVADRLMLVSAADITDPDVVASVTERAELVRRDNEGYDFYSYKLGLESVTDLSPTTWWSSATTATSARWCRGRP